MQKLDIGQRIKVTAKDCPAHGKTGTVKTINGAMLGWAWVEMDERVKTGGMSIRIGVGKLYLLAPAECELEH